MTRSDRCRRWLQFRLRTLLLAVAAVGLLAFAFRTYIEPYAQQRQTIALIKELKGEYQSSDPTPWQRRWFGDDYQNVVRADLADVSDPDKYIAQIARLPLLKTLVVGGEAFNDQHLGRLSSLATLRELVLDSTSVSTEALATSREKRPLVRVHPSQRLAIRKLKTSGWVVANRNDPGSILDLSLGSEHFAEADLVIGRGGSDDDLRAVRALTTLRSLSLSGTKVTDAGLRHLRGLQELDYLDLTNLPITDAGLTGLASIKSLVYLDLGGTQVTDAGLEHLVSLPKLAWLNLNRTQISHVGLRRITAVPSLRMLYVQNMGLTGEEVRALNLLLERCVVLGP